MNQKPNHIMRYGFNIELEEASQSEEDWVGGTLPDLAPIPLEERIKYLPKGERQNIGEEKMDCASRGPLNVIETKFNYLIKNKKLSFENHMWLKGNGYLNDEGQIEFSDRFVAILSGTTAQGNSLKAPLDAIRKNGLIPKIIFPQVESFDEYYNASKITDEMRKLGDEFKSRFVINYEKLYTIDLKDILIVGGYAWPLPVEGEYPPVEHTPNHCFILFTIPQYFAFDNYLDADGDFIKKLSPNYLFLKYAYRVVINKDIVEPKKLSLLERIIRYFI